MRDIIGKTNTCTTIHIISKYANWPDNIAAWEIYPEVQEYWRDGAIYWKKYQRHHPLIAENACDPETGGYGNGYKYHYNFSKLGLDSWYADRVSFTQLIGTPVAGVIDYRNEAQLARDMEVFNELLQDGKHLGYLKQLLFEAEDRIIFTSRSVYNILRTRQGELFGFTTPVLTSAYPLHDYEFRILHAHGSSFLISAQIFSSITDEGYYPRYRLLIDSILKGYKCKWEVIIPGRHLPCKMEGSFHEVMEQLRTREGLDSPVGISLCPLGMIASYQFQIPALQEFFSNQQSARSIHCLIHSDASLETRKERLPGIWEMFHGLSGLLEPASCDLLEACLRECSDKIAANDSTLPSQAARIREVFYYFCFRDLSRMPQYVPDDYYFAEQELVKQIWAVVLDNLDRYGDPVGQEIKASLPEAGCELVITIQDAKGFDFARFIRRNSSLQDYLKMNRFGSLTIASGQSCWCSSQPSAVTDCAEVAGTRITLRFVLKEHEK